MKTTLFDIENWREIGATLARNKTRTFLTAFGIFWGTAMLALLMCGAQGLEGLMRRNFDGFATNSGVFFSDLTSLSYKGFNKGRSWSLTSQDLEMLEARIPQIEFISSVTSTRGSLSYGQRSKSATVMAVDPDYSQIMIPVVNSGRLLIESDERNIRKVCVIGSNLAAELFDGADPVGQRLSINGIYYLVVGVVSQRSNASIGGRLDDSVLVPGRTGRQSFNLGKNIGFIIFTTKKGSSPADVQDKARSMLYKAHSIHPDDERAVAFMDISERFKMVDNLFVGIDILAFFGGLGSLLAGIIGVGNIMWIIVRERTQEIGIRRAIGATPRDIITQILSESVVLTVIAGIAGVCFATIILSAADFLLDDGIHGQAGFTPTFSEMIWVVLTFIVLGTAAGTLPAIKAMKIKPVEAMRDK